MKDKYGVIYKPKGKALEYSDLALNLYNGCDHACIYCFAPGIKRRTREDFHSTITPHKDVIAKLKLDVRDMVAAGDKRNVLLSFTTDPYNKLESELGLTRQALGLLSLAEIPFTVLTKSNRAYEDFGLYTPGRDLFAATLTCIDSDMAAKWEPLAPAPVLRLRQLGLAKRLGIETWVSLEPVIDHQEALKVIRQVHAYADLVKIGKLNYMQPENPIDWKQFTLDAVALCQQLGQEYMIKDDLKKYLE